MKRKRKPSHKAKVMKKQVRIFIKMSGEPEQEIVGVTSFSLTTTTPELRADVLAPGWLWGKPITQFTNGYIEFTAPSLIRMTRNSRRKRKTKV